MNNKIASYPCRRINKNFIYEVKFIKFDKPKKAATIEVYEMDFMTLQSFLREQKDVAIIKIGTSNFHTENVDDDNFKKEYEEEYSLI